jgi:hypothetical protein
MVPDANILTVHIDSRNSILLFDTCYIPSVVCHEVSTIMVNNRKYM